MQLAKPQHEAFAQFFEAPTRDKFRELIRQNIGETDYLDFKAEWPDLVKVARHVLALANSGGGAIILGMKQDEDGSLDAVGLAAFTDKADVSKALKKYVPSSVPYDVLEFEFKDSEYPSIKGKKFQVLIVEYDEARLPILALKSGSEVKSNVAYVRSGTESTEATHEQFEHLINLRIESGYSSQRTLDLVDHLEQLKVLHNSRKSRTVTGLSTQDIFAGLFGHSLKAYYEFIEKLIAKKQARIERELDV